MYTTDQKKGRLKPGNFTHIFSASVFYLTISTNTRNKRFHDTYASLCYDSRTIFLQCDKITGINIAFAESKILRLSKKYSKYHCESPQLIL